MLWVVATPIGHPDDLTLRAHKILGEAELIICESTKEASKLLRHHGITGKTYEVLDEHSKPDDVKALAKMCVSKNVALVSDCGTPAFCDPGADLVRECRKLGVEVRPLLGPSSLMGLLSLAGARLDQFLFRGFLPAESEERRAAWLALKKETRPVVLMDTPYRLKKMLAEIEEHFPQRRIVLAKNISAENEQIWEGRPRDLRERNGDDKAEFMLLLFNEPAPAAKK